MRKGWFIIPGVQEGDRTIEEQMVGIGPALAEAPGKTILDLGCAEGLVGREFLRAGAASMHGIDSIEDHLARARKELWGLAASFECANLNDLIEQKLQAGRINQYDIVLALGVCHKLKYPAQGVVFSARSCGELLLLRVPAFKEAKKGIIRSKHYRGNTCNVFATLEREGFALEQLLEGPRGETVQYWRRV